MSLILNTRENYLGLLFRKTAMCSRNGGSWFASLKSYASQSRMWAAETVLQRRQKGSVCAEGSPHLVSVCIKLPEACTLLPQQWTEMLSGFGGLRHWEWVWALTSFGVMEGSEFSWTLPRVQQWTLGCYVKRPFMNLPLLSLARGVYFSELSSELELLITSKCLLGNLSLLSIFPQLILISRCVELLASSGII